MARRHRIRKRPSHGEHFLGRRYRIKSAEKAGSQSSLVEVSSVVDTEQIVVRRFVRNVFLSVHWLSNVKPKPLEQLHRLLSRWESTLSSPVWYLSVVPQVREWLRTLATESIAMQDFAKAQLYDFFERHLEAGGIALGPPRNWDGERMKIDTVVIHHTSNPPGLRPSRLSAIELIRLYAPYFAKPTYAGDRLLKGQPIYSGHVRIGRQVFWTYHWIVRRNGHAERLLHDSEIGWHAGDWAVNRRSVAIVLDGDYEHARPSPIELIGIARVVRLHYPQVPLARIVGHGEITSKTACPSSLFLDSASAKGWKSDLLDLMSATRRLAS